MKRILILAVVLTLGAGCAETYAADSSDANEWTNAEVSKLTVSLLKGTTFANLDYQTQQCVIGGVLTEFTPSQVRYDLSPADQQKVGEIMEIC